MYAAVIEFLTEEAETKLYANQRPFGVQAAQVWTPTEVEQQKSPIVPIPGHYLSFLNFADDTYILSLHT